MSRHLLREDQERFQGEAWEAYQTLVVPITGGVVFDCTDQILGDGSGQSPTMKRAFNRFSLMTSGSISSWRSGMSLATSQLRR